MKGKWHGQPFFDTSSRKWLITFEVDAPEEFDKLKDKELRIEVKEYREGRSLNANSYFHVLVDKIAKALKISEVESKNQMLARYGQLDNYVKTIILDDEIEWQKLASIHLRPTTHTKVMENGRLYRVYLVIRGSHTYDTTEMGRLIDGTVEEAKALGIETMTPAELERMIKAWDQKKSWLK